jgi:formylmethanofuran dehydrogenase subunit E
MGHEQKSSGKKLSSQKKRDSSSLPKEESVGSTLESEAKCFACGKAVADPKEENHLGDEIICDSCREEMVGSLEEAWVKHSAFLDSALN